jgi:hypothetical protein
VTGRQPDPVHLTTAELAERWHTSPAAIRVMRSRGNAPGSFRRGKDRLTPLAEIEAWEASRMTQAQAAPHAA